MLPAFLLPETTIRETGTSQAVEVSEHQGGVLLLTLGITRIIEQESIDVSIWGSADGSEWDSKPLLAYPQKFYCGTYQLMLDLTEQPHVKFIRAKWQMNRWGKGEPKPLFTIFLFAQEMRREVLAMGA